jgi:Flp pilus assembly protein TadG
MMAKHTEKGQALILIALAGVILFGFAALAIDGSRVFEDRRHAQNAADAAAFAAALSKIRGGNYSNIALGRAASNGYTNSTHSTVTVNLCSDTGITCVGLPAGADPSEFIRVQIISTIPMTFGRVLGWDHLTNTVEAITRVQGSSSTTSPVGAAMVSLKRTGTSFSGTGNFGVKVNGSGIFSNSSDPCSTSFNGNGTIQVDTSITIASGGTQCTGNNITVPGAVAGAQLPYPPANLNVPAPSITCSGNGVVSGTTYGPGNYNSIVVNGGNVTFLPGNYCFNGTVSINGNTNVTANNVNFRINSGGFSINGNSTFTCSNMLVYGVGGSGMAFNGNGSNSCTHVTFYMAAGSVSWNGNVANTFTAPASGDYAGLLIYMPYGNNSSLAINGNSNSGSSGMDTQIIGYTIAASGNSNTVINYNAANQYNPPDSPSIQLTK